MKKLTGSLQEKNGNYYAVINLKVNGKRKPKWIALGLPVKGNKRKAEGMLRELLDEYEQRQQEPTAQESDILLADYMKGWLMSIRSTIATATYDSYRNMVEGRIDRWFRPRQISLLGLTPQHVQDFYQSILSDGCSTNTVIHYHAVLHRALKSAVKKDMILSNPTDKVDKPKKNKFVGGSYNKEEVLSLLKLSEGDLLELPITIAAYYGLRRSEVLGIRWSAVDFEANTIAINHKVIESKVNGKFVLYCEDVLKTKSSIRTLPLIPAVREKLLEQKERQQMFRKLLRTSYSTDYLDYVCTNEQGILLRPNYVSEHFAWLIKKYGLKKLRFHDLRHTCASLMLAAKVDMKQIQKWLGHSNFSTTADIYAHLDYSAHVESAAAMSEILAEQKETPSQESA